MSQSYFQQFANKKKNSAIKEGFIQERKKAKKERAEYFDNKKREERALKKQGLAQNVAKGTPTNQSKKAPSAPASIKRSNVEEVMPLNKFLAHCGVCSRRDAIQFIKEQKVKVNGNIMLEPGYKVQATDEVKFNGKKLYITKNLVYILLNKPKDFITTTDDPQGRKTVQQLIKTATAERVYPIGRLDRNTSGVLLFTNDGELTQKLSHPKYEIKKIYEVKLDKQVSKTDLEKIGAGITLEDGFVQPDAVAFLDSKDRSLVGIEIHSGRNRIVRRIFEHLKYDVKGLDRVMYAGLTKKNVERGKWRFLSEKEIRLLKYMNQSKVKKSEQA